MAIERDFVDESAVPHPPHLNPSRAFSGAKKTVSHCSTLLCEESSRSRDKCVVATSPIFL